MRPWTSSPVRPARSNRRRSPLVGVIVTIGLLCFSVLPARAADPNGEGPSTAPAGGVQIPAMRGQSAAAGSTHIEDLGRAVKASGAELRVPPDQVGAPDPNLAVRPAAPEGGTQSRPPKAPSTTATIPTTTTLEVTATSVVFPAAIHMKATVTPPPPSDGGFLPAVNFYIDGQFNQPSGPLDGNGVGEADVALPPGSYQLTAQFGGLGEYGSELERAGRGRSRPEARSRDRAGRAAAPVQRRLRVRAPHSPDARYEPVDRRRAARRRRHERGRRAVHGPGGRPVVPLVVAAVLHLRAAGPGERHAARRSDPVRRAPRPLDRHGGDARRVFRQRPRLHRRLAHRPGDRRVVDLPLRLR